MGGDDRLGEQAGRVKVADLFRQPPFSRGNRSDRVGDGYFLEHRIGEHGGCLAHKQAVRRRREDPRRSGFTAAPGGPLQGASGADQIIENDDRVSRTWIEQQLALTTPPLRRSSTKRGRLYMQFA